MEIATNQKKNLNALKRIGGQIQGVQRMIENGKCCTDIVIQIQAAIHALYRVGDNILIQHIEHCIRDAVHSESEDRQAAQIDEMASVIKKLHKLS
ncbi:MAG: metal-sensitive transcriptional regulator [Planctomycetota bacterium]|jgi:DNA-binding FrmR family transcriptional regulator